MKTKKFKQEEALERRLKDVEEYKAMLKSDPDHYKSLLKSAEKDVEDLQRKLEKPLIKKTYFEPEKVETVPEEA